MKILVTGGAGFIGSNFINYWLKNHPDDEIVNVDKLTYAADTTNIDTNLINDNYSFVKGDICDTSLMDKLVKESESVINFAAESHVDNSIQSPEPFLRSNYFGVFSLLEAVRKYDVRFHHVSTDEVYGSLSLNSTESFNEDSKYNPRNPYSASKAAGDFLVKAYFNTYGIRATISNCGNNFGPNQHPEKLIPKSILLALSGKTIPIYGNGKQVRDWVFVEDHCVALDLILKNGKFGETYLVSSKNELNNLELVKKILDMLSVNHSVIRFVEDRPGHDVRYSMDSGKIESQLGWRPKFSFEEALKRTVEHYTINMNKYLGKLAPST